MSALLLMALLAAPGGAGSQGAPSAAGSQGAPGAQGGLDAARMAIQRGDAAAAVQGFAQAAELTPGCGDLEYDTGTEAAAAGQVGHAVLHLERALRESPWDSDARQNLERIRQKRVDKVMGTEPGESPLQRLALGLPGRWLFWLGLLAWWAGFGLFVWQRLGRHARPALASLLVVTGVVFAGLAWAAESERAVRYGVVTAGSDEGVKVHSGPAADLPTSFEVHDGLKLLILDSENGFTHVRLGNGLEGYVADGAVSAI